MTDDIQKTRPRGTPGRGPFPATTEHRPERHRHGQFSHIVRGGVVMGLLVLATGSVACEASGLQFSATIQTVLGMIGVLSGAVLGARETVRARLAG